MVKANHALSNSAQLVKAQTGAITHVKARYTVDLVYTNKVGHPFQLSSKFGNRCFPQKRNKK